MSNASLSPSTTFDSPPSPLQELQSDLLTQAGVRLWIKRDDLLHPLYGGNKWRKLKYNLIHAREQGYRCLLTFGGAWSNHIHATAAAGRAFGFDTMGLIRGERPANLSPTLAFAQQQGMQLVFLSREQYRQKNRPDFLDKLKEQYDHPCILPEGGSNALALQGCREIVDELQAQMRDDPFDILCCASGTGATLAGLLAPLQPQQQAIGFSALKGGDFLTQEVINFAGKPASETNWRIETRFHFGGYAKADACLLDFIRRFRHEHGIALDAVYTGKMFYGLWQMIANGEFPTGSRVVAIHSGGLQGNAGFNI